MRRISLVFVLCLLASLSVVPSSEARPPTVGRLGVGDAVFWNGELVAGAVSPPFPFAECGEDESWTYKLEVTEPGARLRVAIDVPMRDDLFRVGVRDPRKRRVASKCNWNQYNAEVFVKDPEPGTWMVTVTTSDATDSAFRLRAKLEGDAHAPAQRRLLRPNLTVTPPYEFGFAAPANPLNGMWPPDDINPSWGAGGVHPVSCAADEMAEDGARRCLRFSSGPLNAGVGPFLLRLVPNGPVFQRVYYSDDSHFDRKAGTWEFHATHGHNHYTDVLTYKLYRVTDRRKGTLASAGKGNKSGFCPADQKFADWHSFAQQRAYSTPSDCASWMGLSTGWGDVYRWQRPGQYVDFGDNLDGYYVVTATADVHDWVLETDESDNVGYAYIAITDSALPVGGEQIKVIERGQGLSPWDPDKVVVRDWWKRL